ncbi:MAG: HD domain-containing protein [Anaerolineales bacterium]
MPLEQASLLPTDIQTHVQTAGASCAFWLVGGAVRDRILQRPVVDFDFVVEGDAIAMARRVADLAGGDFYRLDEARGAGRVLLPIRDQTVCLDFTRIAGEGLEQDLLARDFSINAMALSLEAPDDLIDPAGGLQDLKDGRLRIPSPTAIQSDPIRALRAIRLAVDLGFKIEPDTYSQIKQAGDWLERVSPERQRDELFRILKLDRPALALRLLDQAQLLDALLPEIGALRGQSQAPPHQFDVLEHTLAVMQRLTSVLATLAPVHDGDSAAGMALAEVSFKLGRFRQPLSQYLQQELSTGRTVRQLLYLAAIFHDSGKPEAESLEPDEQRSDGRSHGDKIQFIGHETISANKIVQAAEKFRLSKVETGWLARVVKHHMRPLHLASLDSITKRAVYRYFRQLEGEGVAVAILSLADRLGMTASPPDEDQWKAQVDVVRALLEPYFEAFETSIRPDPLINGNQLMDAFDLPPGPEVGRILEAVLEAQALGEVTTEEDALDYARRCYHSPPLNT